jgi:hypothetical protein
MPGGEDSASSQAAAAVKALAQHACGRSALVAAGGEAALEMLRRLPEHGAGPLAAGPAPQVCTACGALGSRARPLKLCSACRGPERWCSAECQRSSWAGHKAVCKERRAAAASAAAAAGSQRAV